MRLFYCPVHTACLYYRVEIESLDNDSEDDIELWQRHRHEFKSQHQQSVSAQLESKRRRDREIAALLAQKQLTQRYTSVTEKMPVQLTRYNKIAEQLCEPTSLGQEIALESLNQQSVDSSENMCLSGSIDTTRTEKEHEAKKEKSRVEREKKEKERKHRRELQRKIEENKPVRTVSGAHSSAVNSPILYHMVSVMKCSVHSYMHVRRAVFVCMRACLPTCLPVCLSVCLSVCHIYFQTFIYHTKSARQ